MIPRRVGLIAIALGLVGVLLGHIGWHLWTDHQTWHTLLNNLARAGQQVSVESPPALDP